MTRRVKAAPHPLPPHERVTLKNGLGLVLVPDHRLPVMALSLMIRSGAALDGAGAEGLASLTASLLNQGSKRRNARELAEAVDDLGASYSATAGWDSTSITLQGLSTDAGAMLDLLSELALEPAFPPQEFQLMRRRRLHRLARSMDSPAVVADWTLMAHLFHGHPYGFPRAGTGRSLARLPHPSVEQFHLQHYVPNDSLLAVAGDFEMEPTLGRIRQAFGSWSGKAPSPAAPPSPVAPESPQVILVHEGDLTQAQVRWGHGAPHRAHSSHDAAGLMNDPLGGGGFSSRLMQRIRSQKGLTYGISSGFDARALAGCFRVSTFTPHASVVEVLSDMETIISQYRQSGPEAEELDAARDRLTGGYPLQFETASQVAGHLLEMELYGLPEEDLRSYPLRLASVSREEIARLARDLLHPRPDVIVAAGNADRI
ncbi:MAG: M16 family metallopeptidase, partial [Acidobacteriota bacterium]